MPENTVTTWTCSRCGGVEEMPGTEQPKDWIRVGFVNPPKGSWSDLLNVLGDLCNAPKCQGLLHAFIHGEEKAEEARIDEMAEMMAKVEANG